MTQFLGRAEHYANVFHEEAQSTGQKVRLDHERAMATYDVDDLVEIGSAVLEIWFRRVEAWHSEVSKDARNYDERVHDVIQRVESLLIEAADGCLVGIETVEGWGYEVKEKARFLELSLRLKSCAAEISPEFQRTTLRKHFDQAVEDYRRGNVELCRNIWN